MIISIVNQKGGVGKTTTAVNLSASFSSIDKKVLIIDLDPQGNTSTGLGIEQLLRKKTIYHALLGINDINECIVSTAIPNLDIITANNNLSAIDVELAGYKNREYILLNILQKIEMLYDYIIIDCPPSLGLLTLNALSVTDKVLIPMLCDFYSLEGLSHLLKTIQLVEKNLNNKIKIAGILFTMYDARNRLTDQVSKDVKRCLGDLVFDTIIPRNVRVSEAPSHGKPVIIYDYKCLGSLAYLALMQEILQKKIFER